MNSDLFHRILARVDRENSADPNQEMLGGRMVPKEIAHSERMTEWITKLRPDASYELRIAARAQHICRWTLPRSSHDATREGYLRWRQALKVFHSFKIGEIMIEEGATPKEIERVKLLVVKKNLKDSETQTLEDALCLIFLETGFKALRAKTDPEKFRDIVIKTWKKMSAAGHAAALALPLDEEDRNYILGVL